VLTLCSYVEYLDVSYCKISDNGLVGYYIDMLVLYHSECFPCYISAPHKVSPGYNVSVPLVCACVHSFRNDVRTISEKELHGF